MKIGIYIDIFNNLMIIDKSNKAINSKNKKIIYIELLIL